MQEPMNELSHYGVKGQKWGVRRYQNKDGTLTAEGKKHLSENAGWYLNPKYKDKHATNRKTVSKDYQNAYRDLMNKYGIDTSIMDGTEAWIELNKKTGNQNLDSKLWNSFIDKYTDATLKDLGYANTDDARNYVKNLFMPDIIPDEELYQSAIGELFINEVMTENPDDLYHYGVKGMKWGVRRFQNKDGTRTPAGLKRYGDKAKERIRKVGDNIKKHRAEHKAEKAAEKLRKKPLSELTDDELQARIARAQKEKQLFDLERPVSSLNEQKVSAGKAFISTAMQKVIAPSLIDSGKDLLTRYIKDRVGNKLGLNGKEVDDALKGLKDSVAELNLKKQKDEIERYFKNQNKPDTNSNDLLSKPMSELTDSEIDKLSRRLTQIDLINKKKDKDS